MDYRRKILIVADAYAAARGISRARVSTLIQNQGAFLDRIAAGRACTVDTFEEVMAWFSHHWPDKKAWPKGIERPKVSRETGRAA